jgi:hypothetical protein
MGVAFNIVSQETRRGARLDLFNFALIEECTIYEILQRVANPLRQERNFYSGRNILKRLRAAAAPSKRGARRLSVDPMLIHETRKL